jgi:membrane protease YdiL (CAAX protease family)
MGGRGMSDDNQDSTQGVSPDCAAETDAIPPRPPGPGFWGALGCCLLLLAAQVGIGIVAVAGWAMVAMLRGGMPPDAEAFEESVPVTLLFGAGTVSTLLCGLLFVAIAYRRQAARRLALRNASATQWMAVVLIVLPLSVVASELTNWVAMLVPSLMGEMFTQFAQESLAGSLLFGALMAAAGEELCFRGFIGRGLVARYGAVAGVGLTSLLFGLVHGDPVQGSGAMLLGMGIHGVYLATRSLYTAIAVHGLNNALAFAMFALRDRIAVPGYTTSEVGSQFTPWPLLAAALAALAGLALVLRDTRTRFLLADEEPWNPGYTTAEEPPSSIVATPQCGRLQPLSLLVAIVTQAAFLAILLGYLSETF